MATDPTATATPGAAPAEPGAPMTFDTADAALTY
jgi:hypothetical protein